MTTSEEIDAKTNGRWTREEHSKFMIGLKMFGRNWKKIQTLIGTRSGAQIRSHAQKFFLKSKKGAEGPTADQNSPIEEICDSVKLLYQRTTKVDQSQKPESNSHSFFLNKIIKATEHNLNFDFWEMFVDQSSNKEADSQEESTVNRRKDSFVVAETNSELRQESFVQPFGNNCQNSL